MRRTRFHALLAAMLAASSTATDAVAQTTGGVFGPVVREDHRSLQYRSAFDPDTDAFAQRLHYQQAIDSRYMWRVVAQARKTADADVDFDILQGELFWDISDADGPWQTGLRFDVRVRDRGRPGTLGVNWMNDFALSADWKARFLVLTAVDVGDGARDGVALQTRANLSRRLPGNHRAGLELFSSYGTTADFAGSDEQRHGLGPFVSLSLDNGWNLFAGVLFGLTDSTSDTDLRFWLTRGF